MKRFVKVLAFALSLVFCLSLFPSELASLNADAVSYSSHVYMIFTNPGEDCNTQMRIGWHSDYLYEDCYLEYTTADDTSFANAIRVEGSYDDQAYLWFYNRLTTNALSESRFGTMFLDWGVELYDLTPDTDYIYRIQDGEGAYSKTYKFKTAGADEFSILWMSDAHVNSGYAARLLSWRKMVTFAKSVAEYPIAFQFSTGDSVTSGDRYKDWLSIANESFSRDYMIANVIGNHDVYDGIMIADSTNYTQYWKGGQYFQIVNNNPDNGYTHTSQRLSGYLTNDGYTQYTYASANTLFTVSGGNLDGKLISGANQNMDGRAYWFNYNGLLFIIFDYFEMMFAEDTEAALEWAGSVIEENYGKFDYIICANHINLINGGSGTFRDYGAVDYEAFQPFLDNYGVDVFLTGDNHIYLRTSNIYNGAVSEDPSKGTYIIQAPCLSRPQSATYKDAAGFANIQYSIAGSTEGGLVIDVDEDGLTFRCLVYESDRDSIQYYEYDSFTVPKREKAPAAKVGYYSIAAGLSVSFYTEPGAECYCFPNVIDEDIVVYVYEACMQYGLVQTYNGALWIDLSDAVFITGDNRDNIFEHIAFSDGATEIADGNGAYLGADMDAILAKIYSDANSDTTAAVASLNEILNGRGLYAIKYYQSGALKTYYICDSCDPRFVFEESFAESGVDAFVTDVDFEGEVLLIIDPENGSLIFSGEAINFNETIPEGIIVDDDAELVIADGKAELYEGTTVAELESAVLNARIVVTDKDGNVLESAQALTEGATVVVYNGNSEQPIGQFIVTIKASVLLGDVNGDGKINSLDAARILKYDAKLIDLSGDALAAADVNGDGKVNSLDAARILKLDAGLITEF